MSTLEQDQQRLVQQRKQELVDKYRLMDPNISLDDLDSQELVLREISSTLAQRKKLHSQVSRLENELNSLEKIEERKCQAQMSVKTPPQNIKSSRKSRDYRIRTQDWPDVPDIGKIEEQNPEILAQKILETGRKIEASKMIVNPKDDLKDRSNIHKNYSHQNRQQKTTNNNNMPAPMPVSKQRGSKPASNNNATSRTSEPPRVVNFEDRLKSIITSVLNEDEQFRTKQSTKYQTFNNDPQKVPSTTPKTQYPPEIYQNTHLVEDKPKDIPHEHKSMDMYPDPMIRHDIDKQHHRVPPTVEYRKETYEMSTPSPISNKKLTIEQPDYTQVSPAKLALRRHLSQEKLAAQQSIHYQHPEGGLVATRTIGDLMSGEIERTLEISNQSIINAAVDMSDIHGTATVTPRSVVNQNIPPRPERVKLMPMETKETEQRQLYSPISRPSSTEGNLEGLAYLHHSKTPNVITSMPNVNPHINTTVLPSHRSNVMYTPNVNGGMYKMGNRMNYPKPNEDYTPLPRADIKPYHESYFTDAKPPVSIKIVDMEPKNQFVPEGLAATLHARVLNTSVIKEEALDLDTRRECVYPEQYPESTKIMPSNYSGSMVNVKSESECKSPLPYYAAQKRISPVIQGPIRSRKPEGEEITNGVRQGDHPMSPEPHSNTSTPLVDEVPDRENPPRQEEGKISLHYFIVGFMFFVGYYFPFFNYIKFFY